MSDFSVVKARFLRQLKNRGLPVSELDEVRFVVVVGDTELTVSLENVAREALRDRDMMAVDRFVDRIVETRVALPGWTEAKSGIRFSAESSEMDFGDALREAVSDEFSRVLVWVDPNESHIAWITPTQLKDWGIERFELEEAGRRNMSALMSATKLTIEEIDGHRLAMFETYSPFKSSLIFSPNFREAVSPNLGWPVFVVIPCRDFMYALPEKDQELLSRMGEVVIREFEESGYPITTEVLRISDDGIEAIGKFGG